MSLEAFTRRLFHSTGQLDATIEYVTMFDDVTVSSLPSGGSYAYAGYVDGMWPTFADLKVRFPKARLLDMAVFSSGNATGLDIERGDATVDEAPGWFERQVARGVYRPVLYIAASSMKALEQEMAAHHVQRSAYRIWSAHYTDKAHLCSPKTCGYGNSQADGTQWTEDALGISLDQSLLLANFFDPRPAPPKPVDPPKPTPSPAPVGPTWEEAMMNSLPTLGQGDKDGPGKVETVGRMQSLMKYIGQVNAIEAAKDLDVTGEFDLKTTNALLAVQSFYGLKDSDEYTKRVCGPKTWAHLVAG